MAMIRFDQLSYGALARIVVVCHLCLWVPFGIVAGLAALLGASTAKLNGVAVTGGLGLLVGVVTVLGVALVGVVPALLGAGVARLFASRLSGVTITLREAAVPLPPAPASPPRRQTDDEADQQLGL